MNYKLKVIKKVVEEVTGESLWDEKGKKGSVEKSNAKKIFCKIARDVTKSSFLDIGAAINRDHATAFFSCRRAEDFIETEQRFNTIYNQCLERVPQAIKWEMEVKATERYKDLFEYHKAEAQKWFKKWDMQRDKTNYQQALN